MMLFALLIASASPRTVSAHANLVRSEPASGAVLESAPQSIRLEFSEELEPSAASLTLFNADGDILVEGQAQVERASPRSLALNLNRLPDGTYVFLPEGTYSAVWQVQSAVDGHTTNGSVGFSVGEASAPASLLPPPGTPDPATELPNPLATLVRWIGFVAAAIAAGSLIFGMLVWRPAFRSHASHASHASNGYRETDDRALAVIKRLALVGIGLLAIATLLAVLAQASAASLEQVIAGRLGLLALARLGLLAILIFVVLRLGPPGSGHIAPWWAALLLAGGALLTFSLQSHSAASGDPLAVALDWLHMAAMSAWVGGLLPLAFLLRPAQGLPGATLIPRFSTLALASTAVLALSGLYNALAHVRSVEALTNTSYGRALIVKVLLFTLLLGLGAVNLLALSPRLRREEGRERNVRWFGRTIKTEMAIALAVLVATAVLTAVSPATEALSAQRRLGIHGAAQQGGVGLSLWVSPGQVGYNEFGVDLADLRPGAEAVTPTVLLRFTTISHEKGTQHDMGTTQVEAKPEGSGRYVARGSYISMGGTWQVEVIVRQAGFNDVRHTFDLPTSTQQTR